MSELTLTELSSQIKKISDHLVFLEKKLDVLLEQTKERKSFPPKFGGNRDFQRPRPGFGRPNDGSRGNFSRPDGPRNGFGRPGERPQYAQRRPAHGHNSSQGKYFSNKPAR